MGYSGGRQGGFAPPGAECLERDGCALVEKTKQQFVWLLGFVPWFRFVCTASPFTSGCLAYLAQLGAERLFQHLPGASVSLVRALPATTQYWFAVRHDVVARCSRIIRGTLCATWSKKWSVVLFWDVSIGWVEG